MTAEQTVTVMNARFRVGFTGSVLAELIEITTGDRVRHVIRFAGGQVARTCATCGGTGIRPEFGHVFGGQCFPCTGTGRSSKFYGDMDEMLKAERAAARAEQRKAEKAAQAEADKPARIARMYAELVQAHPLLAELTYLGNVNFDAERGPLNYHGILGDLRWKLERYGSLSDRQIELAERIIREDMTRQAREDARQARYAAEREGRPQAAIGEIGERREFTGTVRFTRVYDGDYGPSTLLIIDTDEGTVKWYGTGVIEVERGATVTLRATIKDHEVRDEEIATKVTRGTLTIH
ncbi:MAG TPA: hypothetical protein VD864_16990 [Nocardioides sp.]|nr:hypothetical protein [Nocardioides sp.]